jgi:hypothetical protein
LLQNKKELQKISKNVTTFPEFNPKLGLAGHIFKKILQRSQQIPKILPQFQNITQHTKTHLK